MRELPILFSAPMVAALIDGTKTQTRRIIKGLPENASDELVQIMVSGHHGKHGHVKCPYGKPGDILWVRETWMNGPNAYNGGVPIYYKASASKQIIEEWPGYWKPSIHMRKTNARIWLQVKSVRVERLTSISEADAVSEGISVIPSNDTNYTRYRNYFNKPTCYFSGNETGFYNPIASFMSLICKVNNEEFINPDAWVWVVEFEVLSLTGKPE